jgi:hypothetical protein
MWRLRARWGAHTAVNQIIVNDDIGLRNSRNCVERQHARIAWSGADQPYVSGLQDGKPVVQDR